MFNELTGYIMDPIKEGRYTIKLDRPPKGSSQTLVSCYPANILKVQKPAADAGTKNKNTHHQQQEQQNVDAVAPPKTQLVARGSGTNLTSGTSTAPVDAGDGERKSRLVSEAVTPSDALTMVRNPGTWAWPFCSSMC